MSLVDDEVSPGDVLQRPFLQVCHLVCRDELHIVRSGMREEGIRSCENKEILTTKYSRDFLWQHEFPPTAHQRPNHCLYTTAHPRSFIHAQGAPPRATNGKIFGKKLQRMLPRQTHIVPGGQQHRYLHQLGYRRPIPAESWIIYLCIKWFC